MKLSILFVEDDPNIARVVTRALQEDGYAVTTLGTVGEAVKAINDARFQLLLMDVGLPDGNGFDLCRKLRSEGIHTPVFFLTARADEESAVKGLALGAEDYIRKPFGKHELLARIRRRLKGVRGELHLGKLGIDLDKNRVTYNGEEIAVTPSELAILALLMNSPGEAISRETMLSSIAQEEDAAFERVVDSHVSHLRAKLKRAGIKEVEITPVYGTGYRIGKKG